MVTTQWDRLLSAFMFVAAGQGTETLHQCMVLGGDSAAMVLLGPHERLMQARVTQHGM